MTERIVTVFHELQSTGKEHEFEILCDVYEDEKLHIFQICSAEHCKEIVGKVSYPKVVISMIDDVTHDIDEAKRISHCGTILANILAQEALDIVVRETQFPEGTLCPACLQRLQDAELDNLLKGE
jgi:hypothetical protein